MDSILSPSWQRRNIRRANRFLCCLLALGLLFDFSAYAVTQTLRNKNRVSYLRIIGMSPKLKAFTKTRTSWNSSVDRRIIRREAFRKFTTPEGKIARRAFAAGGANLTSLKIDRAHRLSDHSLKAILLESLHNAVTTPAIEADVVREIGDLAKAITTSGGDLRLKDKPTHDAGIAEAEAMKTAFKNAVTTTRDQINRGIPEQVAFEAGESGIKDTAATLAIHEGNIRYTRAADNRSNGKYLDVNLKPKDGTRPRAMTPTSDALLKSIKQLHDSGAISDETKKDASPRTKKGVETMKTTDAVPLGP